MRQPLMAVWRQILTFETEQICHCWQAKETLFLLYGVCCIPVTQGVPSDEGKSSYAGVFWHAVCNVPLKFPLAVHTAGPTLMKPGSD